MYNWASLIYDTGHCYLCLLLVFKLPVWCLPVFQAEIFEGFGKVRELSWGKKITVKRCWKLTHTDASGRGPWNKMDWFLCKECVSPLLQKIYLPVENSRPWKHLFLCWEDLDFLAKTSLKFNGWAKAGFLWNHKCESFGLWEMRVWAALLTHAACCPGALEEKAALLRSPPKAKLGGENSREENKHGEISAWNLRSETVGRGNDIQSLG